MKMKYCLILALALTGCASVQPLKPQEISQFKSGKTAVSAYDPLKRIKYENVTFYGVGAAMSNTTATYAGFFASEPFISEQLVRNLNSLGAQSKVHQLPDNLWTPNLNAIYTELKIGMGADLTDVANKTVLPPTWKEYFRSAGYDYLFLLVMPNGIGVSTSNFDTKSLVAGFGSNVHLYEVRSGRLLWSYILHGGNLVPFKDSPKEIEGNDFKLLKDALTKTVDKAFSTNGPNYRIDLSLGLRE